MKTITIFTSNSKGFKSFANESTTNPMGGKNITKSITLAEAKQRTAGLPVWNENTISQYTATTFKIEE